MNAFEIISCGFARHVLGDKFTGDPFRDSVLALTGNHVLDNEKGSSGRLSKWAIFRASGSTVASNLACKAVQVNDGRTKIEAFADELQDLREPVVFLEFSKSLVDLGRVFATYDKRMVKLCSAGSSPVVFDLTYDADLKSVSAIERSLRKVWRKRHAA